MIAKDLDKQQPLDPDSKATQEIKSTGNVEINVLIIFIIQ